jgi:hypothetical protein
MSETAVGYLEKLKDVMGPAMEVSVMIFFVQHL